MGSILIRRVPNAVHRKFKKACRQRKISMEQAIVQLIEREVGAAGRRVATKPGRKSKAKRRQARQPARAATRKPARRSAKSPPRGARRRRD